MTVGMSSRPAEGLNALWYDWILRGCKRTFGPFHRGVITTYALEVGAAGDGDYRDHSFSAFRTARCSIHDILPIFRPNDERERLFQSSVSVAPCSEQKGLRLYALRQTARMRRAAVLPYRLPNCFPRPCGRRSACDPHFEEVEKTSISQSKQDENLKPPHATRLQAYRCPVGSSVEHPHARRTGMRSKAALGRRDHLARVNH
jgi:hypothetical protein